MLAKFAHPARLSPRRIAAPTRPTESTDGANLIETLRAGAALLAIGVVMAFAAAAGTHFERAYVVDHGCRAVGVDYADECSR